MFLIRKLKARQEKNKEVVQKEREETIAHFDKALEDAALIDNPIKKVFRLKKVESDIGNEISRTNAKINKKAENKGLWAMAATGLGGIAVAVAVVAGAIALGPVAPAIAPVVIIAFEALAFGSAFGGLLGCPFVSQKISASSSKRLTQAAQGFLKTLNEKKNAASATADQTVTDNAQEIARSISSAPELKSVLDLPGVKNAFTSASIDKLAANDDEAADDVTASQAAATAKKLTL
jgi:hypothetical protein